MAFVPPKLPSVHRAGAPFFLGSLALAVLALAFGLDGLGIALLLLTLYIVFFFRDPDRTTPGGDGFLVSAADGIVTSIAEAVPPAELGMGDTPRLRISTFLSVFDVHVNRNPASGKVSRLVYVPGKFLNATLDKSSEENERQLVRIDMADGRAVAFVQIAGLIARRIICEIAEGETVEAGARMGLIRFGSRVDVWCPPGMRAMVLEGQRVTGGETAIAADGPLAPPLPGHRS